MRRVVFPIREVLVDMQAAILPENWRERATPHFKSGWEDVGGKEGRKT